MTSAPERTEHFPAEHTTHSWLDCRTHCGLNVSAPLHTLVQVYPCWTQPTRYGTRQLRALRGFALGVLAPCTGQASPTRVVEPQPCQEYRFRSQPRAGATRASPAVAHPVPTCTSPGRGSVTSYLPAPRQAMGRLPPNERWATLVEPGRRG